MNKKTLRSVDLAVSGFFLILAFFVGKWSLDLLLSNPDRRFYVSAGFLPLLFSLLFACIHIRIIAVALKEGGSLSLFSPANVRKAVGGSTGLKAVFILGWMAFYLFVMLKRLPYPVSTFVFLTVFMSAFHKRSMLTVLVLSVLTTALITVCFGHIAKIPLP